MNDWIIIEARKHALLLKILDFGDLNDKCKQQLVRLFHYIDMNSSLNKVRVFNIYFSNLSL